MNMDFLWSSAKPHFEKYPAHDGTLHTRTREKWRAQHYFFAFLMFIHLYGPATTPERIQDICVTSRLKGRKAVSKSTWYRIILPAAKEWSMTIDFIHWEDRLQMDNHHPFFPTLFTTIWDTTCIRVEDSGDWALGRYTNNGHYDFPCYLVLLGIMFTGLLVFYSGLHRSTAYDSHIFNDTAHLHPQHPCEMNIGDGHFKNSRNFATPPTKPQGGHFPNADFIFMQYLQLARSRIETLNTVFKRHGMFQSVFRGHVVNLSMFVKIAVHGTAVELRARSRAGRCTRHEGYGWWSHF